jgi:hypothetical protein
MLSESTLRHLMTHSVRRKCGLCTHGSVMAAVTARWNHVWVGTETGILKGGCPGWASGCEGAHWRPRRERRPLPAGVNLQRKQATNFTATGQPRREEAVSALCWGAGGETQVSGRLPDGSWETGRGSLSILPLSACRSWWAARIGR